MLCTFSTDRTHAQTTSFTRQFTVLARFAVFTAVLLGIQVFWDVTLCGWVFALKMEVLLSFEPSETLTPDRVVPSSSYPSILWLVCSSPSRIVASQFCHCCITVSCCFWWLALSIAVEVFLRPYFPDFAPSRMFTTNSLCLTVCPIHEWRLFFKIFKNTLSSFTLWKTSSFVILQGATQKF